MITPCITYAVPANVDSDDPGRVRRRWWWCLCGAQATGAVPDVCPSCGAAADEDPEVQP